MCKDWEKASESDGRVGSGARQDEYYLYVSLSHVSNNEELIYGVAQTLRPTASALEQSAEVTGKWAKRVDRGYEACNKEAGSYFSLLAVSPSLHICSTRVTESSTERNEKP